MSDERWTPSNELMDEMKALCKSIGATRVEVQVPVSVLAPDGKTPLTSYFSVLYLPRLGWTAKNDSRTTSWSQAYIVRHDG